jgi:hypothetical protein
MNTNNKGKKLNNLSINFTKIAKGFSFRQPLLSNKLMLFYKEKKNQDDAHPLGERKRKAVNRLPKGCTHLNTHKNIVATVCQCILNGSSLSAAFGQPIVFSLVRTFK